jgi:DNA ligase (NAD+)
MVYVEKGGEIIPKITGVEFAERTAECVPFEYIDRCPECGAELVRFEGEAKHYCPNQSGCRPQIVGRIVHFIGRKALNIDGLGGETVELLFENGLVRDIADLYSLKAADLAVLPRLGEKSADNIINSIEASKSVPFARVLFGLGIRFVGETTAKYMAAHFKSLEAVAAASKEELMESDEVGDKIADSIIGYFADPVNISILERLRCAGLQFEAEVAERQSDTLAGKNVVVSGKFTLHSRDELKALIELHGGKNQSGVSSNTDFIVAGENMGPAKLQKAEKLGVKILSEQEFIALIGSDEIPKVEEKVVEAQPIQASLF